MLVDVGLPEGPMELDVRSLVNYRRIFAGSSVGSIGETQEVLDFCAEHGIGTQVEIIGGADIPAAYQKVVDSEVRYRYVIDTATF